MKKMIGRISTLAILAVLIAVIVGTGPSRVEAQGGYTRVQQDPQLLEAAVIGGTSATSAATITLTGVPGQYIYIHEIDVQNCAGASAVGAAAPTTVTTTNLPGSLAFTVGSGVGAGLCTNQLITYPKGLKSAAAGTNVTFVLPTFAANQTIRVNVVGSYGF